MKKIVSETIDGSIKNIIQLKTLDASLEYSQLFDALEDCPQEFQSKLVGALNSLGETMQIPPTEAFNKVLCKSDEDEDVKKKLYNWWRAVFEVLSQCDVPDDRVEEYNQKVDDLMAEILKAGDGEATAEEEPEDVFAEEYEPASMKDEAKMLENMDFAIQELGEVATKVQDLVNFVNPYCGTEVNESGDQPKFKVGDVVRVMNVSGMDFYGRDAPIGPIVKIEPPHPDVGVYEYMVKGRSGEFFAYEDELELVPERFTEENDVMNKPARYGIGDHVLYKGEECVVTDVDEDLRNDEEIYQVSRDSDKVDGLSFNDWATWDELEPLEEFTENIGKFNFHVGDVVKVVGKGLASRGWAGIVKKVDRKSQWPYIVKFHNREDGEYAPDEIELVPERFTEEENSKMKKITKERGFCGLEPDYDDLPDDWGSWNNYDGDEDDEGWDMDSADYEMSDDERKEAWRERHPYIEGGKDDGGPWLSEKDIIGMKVSEDSDDGEEFWKDMDRVDDLERRGYWSGAFKVGDKVCWVDPETEEITCGWEVVDAPEDDGVEDPDAMYVIVNDETGSEAEVYGNELRPANMNESGLENELKKSDDGWTTIGHPVSEAKVVVGANDVWDVLELLDNDIANKELTDLINSHVRTEEEIMDAIDELTGEVISKKELNTLLSGRMATLVDYLGLDVERYKDTGEFVDSDKPTSVELESIVDEGFWGGFLGGVAGFFLGGGLLGTALGAVAGSKIQNFFHKRDVIKNLDDVQLLILASCKEAAANGVTADDLKKALEKNKDVDLPDEIDGLVDVGVIKKNGDTIMITAEGKKVLQDAGYDEKAVQDAAKKSGGEKVADNNGSSEGQMAAEQTDGEQKPAEVKSQDKTFNQDGENKTLVTGEEKKEMSDAEAATIMGGASATDMDAADMGVSSHEVADPYKKPVCEMTVEQEVPSPQSLSRMLWGQGKENLNELLTSEYVDDDAIMPMLEDLGLRNLTEINDYFAYDFESILDSLGCDPDAWAERLEIVKKGGEENMK